MMRHRSPSNQTTVPVLDRHGVPLAPTRPSRARRWLETGRATKVWRGGHFAVQRHDLDSAECEVPAVSLRIDPGYRNTGMVVAISLPDGSVQVVAGYVVQHRTNRIVESMTQRSVMRRGRRGRLRRRPARFDNRTRPADWLAPSMRSCVSNIATTVKRLVVLYPVGALHVETTIFDPRLLHDPLVEGTGYQTSERGNMQVREYVLQRDRRTCQYCGAARGRLEVDHVVPKSRGGGYRIDNLVASCRRCNAGKGSQSVEEFLAHDPPRLARIWAQLKTSLRDATHMNYLMALLRKALSDTGLPLVEHDATATACTRRRLGIAKSHVNDAACLGDPPEVQNIPERVTLIRAVGHGRRQMLWPPDKHGSPRHRKGNAGRNSPYRRYCRLSRDRQGFATMPGHRLRQRRAHGITSGDLVRYRHPKRGAVQGYGVLVNGNTRVAVSGGGSVKVQQCMLLARANGYRHEVVPSFQSRPSRVAK